MHSTREHSTSANEETLLRGNPVAESLCRKHYFPVDDSLRSACTRNIFLIQETKNVSDQETMVQNYFFQKHCFLRWFHQTKHFLIMKLCFRITVSGNIAFPDDPFRSVACTRNIFLFLRNENVSDQSFQKLSVFTKTCFWERIILRNWL